MFSGRRGRCFVGFSVFPAVCPPSWDRVATMFRPWCNYNFVVHRKFDGSMSRVFL